MKNVIKTLVLFASVVMFSSANAGELTVTGTAKATYIISAGESSTSVNNKGKALGITNELAFTGTGELDNGYTWKYQVELDDNAAGATTSDDTRLELTTPYGVIAAYNTEGGLSTKYKFSQAAYGAGSDNGASGTMQYGTAIDSYNNVQYHTPAGFLPFETVAKAAWSPSSDKGKNSGNSAGAANANADGSNVMQYQVIASPIDGMGIGASYLEKDGENGTEKYQTGGAYVTYDVGQFSLGYGQHRISNNIDGKTDQASALALTATTAANTATFLNEAISIGFAVNDNLSVSYETEDSEAKKKVVVGSTRADTDTSVTLNVQTVQAAYTMGGMTMSISAKEIENEAYALGRDAKETLLAVVMAF
ncbi:MAG: porin [Pelagibacterales bacterium]|nr:porin [Pelagibacterales bacterium]